MNAWADAASGAPRPFRLLLVCTANRCRSPLAEAIGRSVADAGLLEISSAGLLDEGAAVPATGVEVAARLGLDLGSHRSRRVQPEYLAAADLILTMTREQVRELVVLDPDAWSRTFLLAEFAGWLNEHERPAGVPLGPWIREQASRRPRTELLRPPGDAEIPDPLGRPPRVWRSVARRLTTEMDAVVSRLQAAERESRLGR